MGKLTINSKTKTWEVVDKFEDWVCKKKDWTVIRPYDIIKIKNEYYKFIWTNNFHRQTFKKILSKQSCSLGDYRSYKTVDVSYIVWILNEVPNPIVWRLIKKTPCLLKSVAIYTINTSFINGSDCLKLNETDTIVLTEFENFLKTKMGIKPKEYFENNAGGTAKILVEV